jgi:hypothetical protein
MEGLRESSKADGWHPTWILPEYKARVSSREAIYSGASCIILLLRYKILRLGAATESRRTVIFCFFLSPL